MTTEYTFDANIVSDLHKDAYGMRPTCGFWNTWNDGSDDQRQEIWDGLIKALEREMDEQASAYAAHALKVEARIAITLELVASATRADAVRYLHDAYGTDGDDGYLEYHLGLKYGYFARTAQ